LVSGALVLGVQPLQLPVVKLNVERLWSRVLMNPIWLELLLKSA